jgi:hypothetical protein
MITLKCLSKIVDINSSIRSNGRVHRKVEKKMPIYTSSINVADDITRRAALPIGKKKQGSHKVSFSPESVPL